MGSTTGTGHCIACLRTGPDRHWYQFKDELVIPCATQSNISRLFEGPLSRLRSLGFVPYLLIHVNGNVVDDQVSDIDVPDLVRRQLGIPSVSLKTRSRRST
jgi:hypothetical protein